jgi:hypothetical protein
MTQTLYAHMNKIKLFLKKVWGSNLGRRNSTDKGTEAESTMHCPATEQILYSQT